MLSSTMHGPRSRIRSHGIVWPSCDRPAMEVYGNDANEGTVGSIWGQELQNKINNTHQSIRYLRAQARRTWRDSIDGYGSTAIYWFLCFIIHAFRVLRCASTQLPRHHLGIHRVSTSNQSDYCASLARIWAKEANVHITRKIPFVRAQKLVLSFFMGHLARLSESL